MSDELLDQYERAGFKLVRVTPETKAACDPGWPEQGYSGDLTGFNIGVNHGLSNTCCFDIDDVEAFKVKQANYWELIKTGLQWTSGKPNRLKILFRLEPGQTDLDKHSFPGGMGSFQANRSYDVLPPSSVIDDKTGIRYNYHWIDGFKDPPELPALLRAEFKKPLKSPRKERDRPGFIQAYNEWAERKGLTFDSEIMRTGNYDQTMRGYLRKGSQSGNQFSVYAYADGHHFNFSDFDGPGYLPPSSPVDLYDLLVINKFDGDGDAAKQAVCSGKVNKKLKKMVDKKMGIDTSGTKIVEPSQNTGIVEADFLTVDELLAAAQTRPDYLVTGLIEKGTSNIWSGESGSGKSFLALDLCLRISEGMNWADNTVTRKGALYLYGEGKGGIQRRVSGWCDHHKAKPKQFLAMGKPIILGTENDEYVDELIERITKAVKRRMPDGLGLIVWDTAATMFAINENAAEDVSKILQIVTRIAKECGDAASLVIHHTGHEDKKRARGSYAWLANVDNAELVITRKDPDGAMLTVITAGGKSKDGCVHSMERVFKMKKVVLFKEESMEKPEIATLVPKFYGNMLPGIGLNKEENGKQLIIKYLRDNPGWHTKKELAKKHEDFGYKARTGVYTALERGLDDVQRDDKRGYKYKASS